MSKLTDTLRKSSHVLVAAAIVGGFVGLAGTAHAQDWRRDRDHREYRHHERGGFGIVVNQPPVVYQAPPPVVYAPQPVYQAPPPVVYEPQPSIGFSLNIR